jgi:hypothetical protein
MLVYYFGGYADPKTFDPARAKAVAEWPAKRGPAILAWAKKSADVRVKVAAEAFGLWMPGHAAGEAAPARANGMESALKAAQAAAAKNAAAQKTPSALPRKVAAERLHFYRQVLAAWQFLVDMREQPVLERVAALTQLERTPLPPASVGAAQ